MVPWVTRDAASIPARMGRENTGRPRQTRASRTVPVLEARPKLYTKQAPERVLWLRRKCHEFTHQGGRNAASAPRGVDSQPADLTELRGMEPTSSRGDAAAFACVGIGSFGIADWSESKAADDPLLRARAHPGYPECQVRGLINVPLISRRWRPTIVRTSRDARALVHRRDFGRILQSIRLRHPVVKSLQLLRFLGAVPSN